MLIKTHVLLFPLFYNTTVYLLYWHIQKKTLISEKIKSYKGLHDKNVSPMPCHALPPSPILFPHMLAVNQTSFFHPKNVESLILNWGGQLT